MYWLVIKSMAGLDVPSSDSYLRQRRKKNYKQTYTHSLPMNYKEIPRKKFQFNGNCFVFNGSGAENKFRVNINNMQSHCLVPIENCRSYIENENAMSSSKYASILINDNNHLLITLIDFMAIVSFFG